MLPRNESIFPPLAQLPKYHVYEDGIMFILGLIGLVIFIKDVFANKKMSVASLSAINLKPYKAIFEIKKDAVFATVSHEGTANIVPIHSKHLVSKDRVLISDQFMGKTKQNILNDPHATLTIMDSGKIYNLSGTCLYKTSGFFYSMAVRGAQKYAKKNAQDKSIKINCKGIVLMKVLHFTVEEA